MNKFNSVFLAIKKHCGQDGEIKGPESYNIIAKEAGVPVDNIEFLLNTLQDLQLVKHSLKEQYIRLTSFGKQQQRLFIDS